MAEYIVAVDVTRARFPADAGWALSGRVHREAHDIVTVEVHIVTVDAQCTTSAPVHQKGAADQKTHFVISCT